MSERIERLTQWLQQHFELQTIHLIPIVNDASFRRYFRIEVAETTYIVADVPAHHGENCQPFIDVATRLGRAQLNAPNVIAIEQEQGFLILTDLGNHLYLKALQDKTQADSLYSDAIQALIVMQSQIDPIGLPHYDHQLLLNEMHLFTHWLLERHLNVPVHPAAQEDLDRCFNLLIESALSQPQVFVHRDYHSRNLMVTPTQNPGILDFQDAVKGAITYDLVSLLRDCYINWQPEQIATWLHQYYQQAMATGLLKDVTEAQLTRWFDWMGIQRHLKASGIFARLYRRDNKDGYLKDIPRTLNYIVEVTEKYPELDTLHQVVSKHVIPVFMQKMVN